MNLYEKTKCATCGAEIENIEVFPRGNCIKCHMKIEDSKPLEEIEKDIKKAFYGAIITI